MFKTSSSKGFENKKTRKKVQILSSDRGKILNNLFLIRDFILYIIIYFIIIYKTKQLLLVSFLQNSLATPGSNQK